MTDKTVSVPAEKCPSCQAIDNNPYTDANGVSMRACGRCMIQWRAASSSLLPVGRQLECGQNSVLDADLVGCGKAIKEAEIFRCVDCGVPFHRECARKHFIAGESVLTAAMVEEQSRRDTSREGLRIVCSARDYLNEQIPKDWTATELLNGLWGKFMKEQSGWKELASLPVGESTREKCGKPAASFIPRWGQSFACVLEPNHEGECRPGGACVAHGAYIGEPNVPPQCPKWPECVKDALRLGLDKYAAEFGLGESREPLKQEEDVIQGPTISHKHLDKMTNQELHLFVSFLSKKLSEVVYELKTRGI